MQNVNRIMPSTCTQLKLRQTDTTYCARLATKIHNAYRAYEVEVAYKVLQTMSV